MRIPPVLALLLLFVAVAHPGYSAPKKPPASHARLQPRFVGDWMEDGASRQLVEIRSKGPKVGVIRFWAGKRVQTYRYYWEGLDQVRVDRMISHDQLLVGPVYRVSFRNGAMHWRNLDGRNEIASGELRKKLQASSGDLQFVRIRRPSPARP